MDHSCIHLYTGDGKGKTSNAVGLMTRAYGRGFKILFSQFLKGCDSGEILTFTRHMPDITILKRNFPTKFIYQMDEKERNDVALDLQKQFAACEKLILEQQFDMIVLDELLGVLENKLISITSIRDFLKNKPAGLEVVMTGRHAPQELIELAHYVSEIKAVKHPYSVGISARRGIEF